MAMTNRARALKATPAASHWLGRLSLATTTVGSGSTAAAPMAVKCMLQMARVSRPEALANRQGVLPQSPPSRRATLSAAAPKAMPRPTDQATRDGFHRMRPSMRKAAMPI